MNIGLNCDQHSPMAEQRHELTVCEDILPGLRDKFTLSQFHPYWWTLSGVFKNKYETKIQGVKEPGVYILSVKNIS